VRSSSVPAHTVVELCPVRRRGQLGHTGHNVVSWSAKLFDRAASN
jgi:hypothetical protein